MRELKAGDTVFVDNWGAKFPVYEDWFMKQIMDHKDDFNIAWAIRFAYGISGEVSPKDAEYKVLYVEDDKALTKIRRMTRAEIEEELGYKIKIIGGYDA